MIPLAWIGPTSGAGTTPPALVGVEIVEQLGARVPGELVFKDDRGHPVAWSELVNHGRPIVLTMAYARCPMLCDLILSTLATSLSQTGLVMGRDYDAVNVTLDPREGPDAASESRRGHLQSMGIAQTAAVWPFLTGDDRNIVALAGAVGFHYHLDPETGDYAHPAAVFILAPDGKITRYLYGLPSSPRDLRLALVEASAGRIGTTTDRILLTCFRYDPALRRYAWFVPGVLRGGGTAVFLALGTLLSILWRRELRARAPGKRAS